MVSAMSTRSMPACAAFDAIMVVASPSRSRRPVPRRTRTLAGCAGTAWARAAAYRVGAVPLGRPSYRPSHRSRPAVRLLWGGRIRAPRDGAAHESAVQMVGASGPGVCGVARGRPGSRHAGPVAGGPGIGSACGRAAAGRPGLSRHAIACGRRTADGGWYCPAPPYDARACRRCGWRRVYSDRYAAMGAGDGSYPCRVSDACGRQRLTSATRRPCRRGAWPGRRSVRPHGGHGPGSMMRYFPSCSWKLVEYSR